jgi:parallel beta-helix repeat protein
MIHKSIERNTFLLLISTKNKMRYGISIMAYLVFFLFLTFNLSSDINFNTILSSSFPHSSTSDQISIDGNIELQNFPNKTGSGIFGDPYIIENLTIDINYSDYGISIRNTDKFLIIRNCSLFNNDSYYYNGYHNSVGITLLNSTNISLENCSFDYGTIGISLKNSDGNNILENNFSNQYYIGISLEYSNGNNISDNSIDNDGISAIYLSSSIQNNLTGNFITAGSFGPLITPILTGYGINLENSSFNKLLNNYIIDAGLFIDESYNNQIDQTNIINGNPIYYYENQINLNIDGDFNDVGQLILINCNYSIFSNLNISNTSIAIQIDNSNDCDFQGSILTNNKIGFRIDYSHNNVIFENYIIDARYGISLHSSNNNNILANSFHNIEFEGIKAYQSNYNNLTGNIIRGDIMTWGISSSFSDSNTLTFNDISQCTMGIILFQDINFFIMNNNICENYYGIYIIGVENSTLLENNVYNNLLNGFEIVDSEYNSFIRNNASNNSESGFHLNSANHNSFFETIAKNNSYGIYLENSSFNSFNQILEIKDNIIANFYINGSDNIFYDNSTIDGDFDDLFDWEEEIFETDPTNPDTDNDGLTDGEEIHEYQTNPLSNDTDSDGLPDGWEVQYNLDPLLNDTMEDPDNDNLTNLEEYLLGTNPQKVDTDNDGIPDNMDPNPNSFLNPTGILLIIIGGGGLGIITFLFRKKTKKMKIT